MCAYYTVDNGMRGEVAARTERLSRKHPRVSRPFTPSLQILQLHRIVGSFASDGHIVRVRLPQTGGGDAHELRVGAQLVDRRAPYVAHPGPEAADHLEQDVRDWALVRHASLDSLGYELPGRHLAFLEIPIRASVLHCRETSHAANHLEPPALQKNRLARALLRSRQHRAHH